MEEPAVNPHELAVLFLSHFIDASKDELDSMEITIALTGLITQVVSNTVEIINTERRVLH